MGAAGGSALSLVGCIVTAAAMSLSSVCVRVFVSGIHAQSLCCNSFASAQEKVADAPLSRDRDPMSPGTGLGSSGQAGGFWTSAAGGGGHMSHRLTPSRAPSRLNDSLLLQLI